MSTQPVTTVRGVPLDEWLQTEKHSGFAPTGKHADVFEAITKLRANRELLLKIPGDEAKRKIVLQYSKRKFLKLRTFVEDGHVYMRRRDCRPELSKQSLVIPTTAAEWRKIQLKRTQQSKENISHSSGRPRRER